MSLSPENRAEILEQAAVAVTVLDLTGRIVFYNRYAPRILDRKPQYLGRDIRSFHQPASNQKTDRILAEYAAGGREEYAWRLEREGKVLAVRVAPWLRDDGRCRGLIHTVMPL